MVGEDGDSKVMQEAITVLERARAQDLEGDETVVDA